MPRTLALGVAVCLGVGATGTYVTVRERHLDAAAALERGVAAFHDNAFAQAEPDLQRAVDEGAPDWRASYYLGSTLMMERQFPRAIPHLEAALLLNPQEKKILNALGISYFKLGRTDIAKGYFSAVLELDPQAADASWLLGALEKMERSPVATPGAESPP